MNTVFIIHFIAAALVLLGLIGLILPAIPGIPLIFVGLVVSAWADGFTHVGWVTLLILGVMTALSVVVDLSASAIGAQKAGASRLAIWGSIVGSLAGLFFLPIGLIAGPFIGALAGEYFHSRQLGLAAKVSLATMAGLVIGVALKLGLAIGMLLVFAAAWLL